MASFCKTRQLMFIALAAVAMTGFAASEPTEEEIRKLTEQDVARANEPVYQYHQQQGNKGKVPEDMLVKVNSVRKVGCKPAADANAYDCDVEMDLTVPNGGRRSRIVSVQFKRTDAGWAGNR